MAGGGTADQPMSCAIAVMAKASVPGRAKTRLVPPLSAEDAASLNTSFLRDVADSLIAASTLANIAGCMAFAPAGSAGFFRGIMPERIGLLETVAPSFGECLLHAATSLFDAGHGAVSCSTPTAPPCRLLILSLRRQRLRLPATVSCWGRRPTAAIT